MTTGVLRLNCSRNKQRQRKTIIRARRLARRGLARAFGITLLMRKTQLLDSYMENNSQSPSLEDVAG